MQYWAVNDKTKSDPMKIGPHLSSYGPGDRFTTKRDRLASIVMVIAKHTNNDWKDNQLEIQKKQIYVTMQRRPWRLLTLKH